MLAMDYSETPLCELPVSQNEPDLYKTQPCLPYTQQ